MGAGEGRAVLDDASEAFVLGLLAAGSMAEARSIIEGSSRLLRQDLIDGVAAIGEHARRAGDHSASDAFSFWAHVLDRCLVVGAAEAFAEMEGRPLGVANAWGNAKEASASARTEAELTAAADAWRGLLGIVEAIRPRPLVHSIGLAGLAEIMLRRLQIAGDDADLTGAIELLSRAASDDRDPEWRAGVQNNLGGALALRYEQLGNADDLDAAIDAFARAVDQADATTRSAALSGLGNARLTRFEAAGDRADLELALTALDQALRVHPTPVERPGLLTNLGLGLLTRYEQDGAEGDLQRAVESFREADALLPDDAPEWVSVQANLALGLLARYELAGDIDLVDEASGILRRALGRIDQRSPDRPGLLHSLGVAEQAGYARTGELDRLVAATGAVDEAVRTTPAGAPERSIYLDSLAAWRADLFLRTGAEADLLASIQAAEAALDGTPRGATERPRRLSTLANALAAQSPEPATLDRSIALSQEALDLAPPESAEKWIYTANLAAGLLDRWEADRDRPDLDRAVDGYESALQAAPPEASEVAALLHNLGAALQLRYEAYGRSADADRAAEAYQRARRLGSVRQPEVALLAAIALGDLASRRSRWSDGGAAYGHGLEAMERLVRAQTTRRHREAWLRAAQVLPARAAYAALQAGQPTSVAALRLEAGRALLLSDALERNRVDLSRLRDGGHADLAERYQRLVQRLAVLENTPVQVRAQTAERPDPAAHRH